jgi:hypothetical protein
MKQTLLLTTLLAIAFTGLGQDEKSNKFSIGLSIIPTYTTVLYMNDGSQDAQTVEGAFSEYEIPFTGLNGGIDVFYKINKRWQVCTGVHHKQAGWNFKEMTLYSLVYDPSLPEKVSWQYRYQYIHVPLEMRFYICHGFFAQTGVGLNVLYNTYYTSIKTFSDGRVETEKKANTYDKHSTLVISANLQTGYTFNRNGNWNYSIAAYSFLGINGIAHDVPLNRRFFGLGSALQVRYSF